MNLQPVDSIFVVLAVIVAALFLLGDKLKKFDVPLVFILAVSMVVIPVLGLAAVGMHKLGLAGPVGIAS